MLARNRRRSASAVASLSVLLTVFMAACGARPSTENADAECTPRPLPEHAELLVLTGLLDVDIDTFVGAAIAVVEGVQADAERAFHGGSLPPLEPSGAPDDASAVEARRRFLDRYVYVDPPLLYAEGPGFMWSRELVLAVAGRAAVARRPDLVARWFAALAPFSYDIDDRSACLRPSRGRPVRATLAPPPGTPGATWTRSSF